MGVPSRKHFIARGDGVANYERLILKTAAAMNEEPETIRKALHAFQESVADQVLEGKVVPLPGVGRFRGMEVDGEVHMIFEPEQGSPMRLYSSEPLRRRNEDGGTT